MVDGRVKETVAEIQAELLAEDAYPFIPESYKKLIDEICRYISELIDESHDEARRAKAGVILEEHVDIARKRLSAHAGSKLNRNLGTIGGILLGAAISTFLSTSIATPGNEPSWQGVLISGLFGIVGSSMVAWSVAKE